MASLKKRIYEVYLKANMLTSTIKHHPIDNIYYATTQKTGSQWIKNIFNDKRIRKYTKLKTYPQRRYEWGEFINKFPKYTFIPGLYMPYELYEEIKKPNNYKTFYITRDPRDIVVSWYYSMFKTHAPMGKVEKHRNYLQKVDIDEGLTYCIKKLSLKFAFMRTWFFNNDTNVYICRFEDLVANPIKEFDSILSHCNVDVPQNILEEVLHDYSKNKMREKDLEKRKDKSLSHYRDKPYSYTEIFKEKHYDLFYQLNGNLLELVGYE